MAYFVILSTAKDLKNEILHFVQNDMHNIPFSRLVSSKTQNLG